MNPKRIITIVVMLNLGVYLFVLGYSYYMKHEGPSAEHGVIDLRNWRIDGQGRLPLNGGWLFYPGQLLTSDSDAFDAKAVDINVPGKWSISGTDDSGMGLIGYGTYRLTILLGKKNEAGLMALNFRSVFSSSRVFIDGKLLAGSGIPAADKVGYKPVNSPLNVYFEPVSGTVDLFVQVANFDHLSQGGITTTVTLGPASLMERQRQLSLSLEFGIFLAFIFIGFVYLILAKSGIQRMSGTGYFAWFCLFSAYNTAMMNEKWNYILFPGLPLSWQIKSTIVSTVLSGICMLLFVARRYRSHAIPLMTKLLLVTSATFGLFSIFGDIRHVTFLIPFWTVFIFLLFLYSAFVLCRSAIHGDKNSPFEFAMVFTYISFAFLRKSIVYAKSDLGNVWSVEFLLFIVVLSVMLAQRYVVSYTKNASLSRELGRLFRKREEFLAQTSHEFRTPLHVMTNIAQTLLDNGPQNTDGSQEQLRTLVSVGGQAERLLDDLLDWSKLREGTLDIRLQQVDVRQTVQLSLEMMRYLTSSDHVLLVNKIEPGLTYALADEHRLLQILINLIHNAIKYTSKGRVTVSAEHSGEMLNIKVSDTGIGIPDGKLGAIFEPFERIRPASGSMPGIGLGLAVARRLAELMNGTIEAESRLSEGSTFTVRLPAAGGEEREHRDSREAVMDDALAGGRMTGETETVVAKRGERNAPKRQSGEKYSVLVVDNEPVGLKVMQNMLRAGGIETEAVHSGEEALRMLRCGRSWDLVIMDLIMPDMTGLELCRQIRRKHPLYELPILMITACGRQEDITASFDAGANDFVMKAAGAAELRSRVRTLLEMKRSIANHLRMEAAFLQAQIKPHFMLNTLNSIASLSEEEPQRMRELLVEFGDYLRESFRFTNTEPLVSLERELTLVKAYLEIERIRFSGRLKYSIEADEGLNAMLPPLSIQPFVENAVRHGVLNKRGSGTVDVSVHPEDGRLTVRIRDDGAGFDVSELGKAGAASNRGTSGIGVRNVRKRLGQLFGVDIELQSEMGKGTVVSFKIPLIEVNMRESDAG
ncbi:response regulator [Paenibacillus sp. sptzw28]|uniref:hybrid sensor histidine kinase/response regulator n=1 Tax=Paenibacillus sp. sptzw28 TaxID=715179 RepID=UPI001C6F49F4|nr:ATP-binding protein [Paenibacillus sp. sptzw28]QYR19352.1 response regulator [Paenibacillus sp. sptzw28]